VNNPNKNNNQQFLKVHLKVIITLIDVEMSDEQQKALDESMALAQ
jgi:hypothetical protein